MDTLDETTRHYVYRGKSGPRDSNYFGAAAQIARLFCERVHIPYSPGPGNS
jgi:hypothetical protein